LGLASPLNFESSKYKELRDYELGHVKEGVGAGGISLLAFLDGFKNEEIVSLCQQNLEMMKGPRSNFFREGLLNVFKIRNQKRIFKLW